MSLYTRLYIGVALVALLLMAEILGIGVLPKALIYFITMIYIGLLIMIIVLDTE